MIKLKSGVILLLWMMTSCGNITNSPPLTIPVESSTPQATTTPVSTLTPTKTIAPTPSPQATLTKEQAQEAITEFMTKNGGCSKPCFWGFNPKDGFRADEVFQFFAFLHEKPRAVNDLGYLQHIASINYKKRVNIGATFSYNDEEETLKNIYVDIHGLSYFPEITYDDWAAFRPDTILKIYGEPSNVEFFLSYPTEPTTDQTIGYDFRFHYENEKFVIAYTGQRTLNQGQLRVCPLKDANISSIYLYLGDDLKIKPIRGKSLPEISPLSIKDFYTIMTDDTKDACFNLDRDAFNQ